MRAYLFFLMFCLKLLQVFQMDALEEDPAFGKKNLRTSASSNEKPSKHETDSKHKDKDKDKKEKEKEKEKKKKTVSEKETKEIKERDPAPLDVSVNVVTRAMCSVEAASLIGAFQS